MRHFAYYTVMVVLLVFALIGLGVSFSTTKAPVTAIQQLTEAWVDDDDPTCGGNSPCFQTIQAAIDAVQLGPHQSGTVHIRPGLYREHVVLTKNVKLEGAGRELVRLEAPDSTKPVIFVKGTYLSGLSGLGIFSGSVGILVEDAEVFAIKYNRIAGYTESGIRLVRSQASISSNELPDYIPSDIDPASSLLIGTGIDVLEGSRATIAGNVIRPLIQIHGQRSPLQRSYAEISWNLLGSIEVRFGGAASIFSNQLSSPMGRLIGITVVKDASAQIFSNQVQGYGIGIEIGSDGQADIHNNLIVGNGTGIRTGVEKRFSPAPPPRFRILRNRIVSNHLGLALYEGQGLYGLPRAEVKYNWISENSGSPGTYSDPDAGGGVQFRQQVRLDFSNNFVINNYYGICPYLERDEDIDPEALQGSNNEIRDNVSDLCGADTHYPWPPGFRK